MRRRLRRQQLLLLMLCRRAIPRQRGTSPAPKATAVAATAAATATAPDAGDAASATSAASGARRRERRDGHEAGVVDVEATRRPLSLTRPSIRPLPLWDVRRRRQRAEHAQRVICNGAHAATG